MLRTCLPSYLTAKWVHCTLLLVCMCGRERRHRLLRVLIQDHKLSGQKRTPNSDIWQNKVAKFKWVGIKHTSTLVELMTSKIGCPNGTMSGWNIHGKSLLTVTISSIGISMITYTIFMQVKLLYDPSVQMTSCFPIWQPSACNTNFSTAGMQTQFFLYFQWNP